MMHAKIIVVFLGILAICAAMPDRHVRRHHDLDRITHHWNYMEQQESEQYEGQEPTDGESIDNRSNHQHNGVHKSNTHRRHHKISHHESITQSTFIEDTPRIQLNIAELNPFRISVGKPRKVEETVHRTSLDASLDGREGLLQSRFQNADYYDGSNNENGLNNNHYKGKHSDQRKNSNKNTQYQNNNPDLENILKKVVNAFNGVVNIQSNDGHDQAIKSTTDEIVERYPLHSENHDMNYDDGLHEKFNNLKVINNTDDESYAETVKTDDQNVPLIETLESINKTESIAIQKDINDNHNNGNQNTSDNSPDITELSNNATKENAEEVTLKNNGFDNNSTVPGPCQINGTKDTRVTTSDSEETNPPSIGPDSVRNEEVSANECEEDLRIDDRFGAGVVASLLG